MTNSSTEFLLTCNYIMRKIASYACDGYQTNLGPLLSNFVCSNFFRHIFKRMSPILLFRVVSKQTTGHSLWSLCLKTEPRSMSWWPRRCLTRECKCLTCFLHLAVCLLSFTDLSSFSWFSHQVAATDQSEGRCYEGQSTSERVSESPLNLYLIFLYVPDPLQPNDSIIKPHSIYICIALGRLTKILL